MAAGWHHRYATINGIRTHWVEQGWGPLVVLLHGFPHTYYSWRHQIGPIAAAGYRVVAPDLRGMGRTEGPEELSAYHVRDRVDDVLGLLDHHGEQQAIFIGLDFGVMTAYDIAHLHPERVRGIIGLENPFFTGGSESPLTGYNRMAEKHFLHIAYFVNQYDEAVADLNARPREFFTRVLWALSGEGDYHAVFRHPPGTHYVDALPEAPPLPWPWLSEADLEHYVADYSASGFVAALNWYRSMDLVWQDRAPYADNAADVPYYFIGSENDIDLDTFHGDEPLQKLRDHWSDLRKVTMIDAAGHLMQQESPDEVTTAILDNLADLAGNPPG
ncbi:MAG: alpha/beta hydrolase [Propionibacterium sp.]|nr:alpha/beta hydrolase [Propionibacterium sp.]